MTGNLCFVLTALTGLAFAAAPLGAAEYFVSPRGNDAGAGTSAQEAFQTIGKAVQLVEAGDTINIAPGSYSERIRLTRSGTADAPITLRKRGDGEVVLTTPLPDIRPFFEKYAEGFDNILVQHGILSMVTQGQPTNVVGEPLAERYRIMAEIKQALDPDNLANPGRLIDMEIMKQEGVI